MINTRKRILIVLSALSAFLLLSGALFLWVGFYNFAADVEHSRPVYSLIETARERSVFVRAAKIAVPPLEDPAGIVKGAGNYQAMCVQCHLAPGLDSTELSRGLYPSPPALTKVIVDPAVAFWTIKHGIKASGMPAWGRSMSDPDIWNLVAFVKKLPGMEAAAYRELVEDSAGHSHAGQADPMSDETEHDMRDGEHGKRNVTQPKPRAGAETAHTHKEDEQH